MPSRLATEVVVTIDGAPLSYLRPLTVHRTTGGMHRDEAVIEVDLSSQGTGQNWIIDFAMNGSSGSAVQVWSYPGGVPTLIHSGVLVLPSIKIGHEEERLTFTSRVEPWMFGVVMDGYYVWEPVSGQLVTILGELVFNPEIDGTVLPNMSTTLWLAGQAPVILDPESCRTPAALELQGNSADYWTLPTALAYLCWALNPDQTYVANPPAAAFAVLPDWPLQNFELERGKFLSDYLDEILPRFGLGWYLDLSTGAPIITFFARGLGTLNSVYLGYPGSVYSGDNALDTDLHWDAGNVRNQAVVYGDFWYVEATFTLQKGWHSSLDNTAEANLSKDSSAYNNDANGYRDVHRLWVLNEAGDHNGVRPEIDEAYSFDTLFGTPTVPRRRAFLPCITLDNSLAPRGEVAGITVQWSINAGASWNDVSALSDRTCVVLDRECGIRFDGLLPPAELRRVCQENPANVQVRVCATVRSDIRLGSVQGPYATSPLAATAPFMLDESAKFHWRTIDESSLNFEAVDSGELTADTADDTEALLAYTAWVQAAFDIADAHGSIVVEGLDTTGQAGDYDLAQLVEGIFGRSIDFNAQSAASGTFRFPQIVGIAYDCQHQTRTLQLETYRDPGLFAPVALHRERQQAQRAKKQLRSNKKANNIMGLGAG